MSPVASHAAFRPRTLTAVAAAVLATAALLGSPAIAAAAQPDGAVYQTAVHYSLRDLSSDQGAHALYRRILDAARMVCPAGDSRDLGEFAASRKCQRQAVARAVAQIGNARLAAVYSRNLAKHG
ncbi:MAG TPA: UrcA family protein [Steroidobacteraceae bacterium]|jgi:UrcA family protein|nr:UrcA family protein [Steroidobacteraceae bacterium]